MAEVSSPSLSFAQLNTGCGRAATALLSSDTMLEQFDVILIQEPYCQLGNAVGINRKFSVVCAPLPRSAIFVNPTLTYNLMYVDELICAIFLDQYDLFIFKFLMMSMTVEGCIL